MKKIVEIYYDDKSENYETGLVLVLEDGTTLKHYSTDVIKTFDTPAEINRRYLK